MNYLQLAQRLRIKCRVSGSGPVAVTGQNAEYTRLLLYVNEAWMAIQRMHTDWRFMRASASCATVAGQSQYAPATDFALADFGNWALDFESNDTFRNYVTAQGTGSEIFMGNMDYDQWRDTYLFGGFRSTRTRPTQVAVAPNDSICVGPLPEAGYTLLGDYYKTPSEMAASTDTPTLPTKYHDAIVYRAMMFYGASEAAPEVYDDGKINFAKIIREIEATQLRRMRLGGALA